MRRRWMLLHRYVIISFVSLQCEILNLYLLILLILFAFSLISLAIMLDTQIPYLFILVFFRAITIATLHGSFIYRCEHVLFSLVIWMKQRILEDQEFASVRTQRIPFCWVFKDWTDETFVSKGVTFMKLFQSRTNYRCRNLWKQKISEIKITLCAIISLGWHLFVLLPVFLVHMCVVFIVEYPFCLSISFLFASHFFLSPFSHSPRSSYTHRKIPFTLLS